MSQDQEIRFLGDLQRLRPEPGDVFVLTTPGPISMDQVERIKAHWREALGHTKLIVLDGGSKLGCIAGPAPANYG